ncbi:MAG: hypothetical protein QW607_05995 [Desulfurococcaceae archaeon]
MALEVQRVSEFPEYIFAVGGAGKRTVLGMFGYDYDRGTFRDRSHFDWLVSHLIRTDRSFNVYIIDTETNTKQKDVEICNGMNKAVGEVRNRLQGHTGNVVFSAINLEPPTGYSYETISGSNSIDVIKDYLISNNHGKYYWINSEHGYGDVDEEIFKKVNSIFGINRLELSAGVQRNRAVTKTLWYYFLRDIGRGLLPNLQNEKIAIFGGLGGGTGSTLIVELSRKYYNNNEVFIFGILPAINGETQLSNACGYITLTELERLSITNPGFRNHTHVILIPINFVPPGINIPTSGEAQGELKDFPLAVLYLVLSVFRLTTGGENPLLPSSSGVDFKMARPFILAPTYLIEVIGSSKIEEDFRNTFSETREAIKEINQFIQKIDRFIQKHFGAVKELPSEPELKTVKELPSEPELKTVKELPSEPELKTYIKLIRLFETELNQMKTFINLYEKFGSKSVKDLNGVVNEYIDSLTRSFEKIEEVINKLGISESAKIELDKDKTLKYYSVLVLTHKGILDQIDKFKFSSELDNLFFEVLREWISNLRDIVNIAKKIEEEFINKLKIDEEFWNLLFLSSDNSKIKNLISSLMLQIDDIEQEKNELEKEIKRINDTKNNLIQNLESSKELKDLVSEIINFRREKDILCNPSTIENFRQFLEEYLEELKRKDKKYMLKYEGNLTNGAMRLVDEIKIKSRSGEYKESGEYGKYIDNFLNLLEIAQKYDPNLSKNKYTIQLTRAFAHRYHSLMSKRTFKVFGGSSDHKQRMEMAETDIERDYVNGFSLFYPIQRGELGVALTVKEKPLINYLEEIAERKEKDLKDKMHKILNEIIDKIIPADLKELISIPKELKFESIDDLIREVTQGLDKMIGKLKERLEKVLEVWKILDETIGFSKKCINYKDNMTSRLKELQERLGRSQQELCSQFEWPKLKYTVTIQRRGELSDLLKDEEICEVLTSYLANQIRCFLNNHSIYLGFRERVIKHQDMMISFDKAYAILGIPREAENHQILINNLNDVISKGIYHGGKAIINYRENESAAVYIYNITRENTISITLLLVGVCLDNISLVERYYKENFERMFNTAGDAIYIKYVYDLENGKFYVRRLVKDLGGVYVKKDVTLINEDILKHYEERSYLKKST